MSILKNNQSDDLTLKYLLENNKTDVSGIETELQNIDGQIGDTPLPTTAQTITGAIDELCPIAFTVTLTSGSWSNNAQTVSNANFLTGDYAYIVTPASSNFKAYGDAAIYADNVTTNGSMTFHCTAAPTSNLTVNVVRMVTQ